MCVVYVCVCVYVCMCVCVFVCVREEIKLLINEFVYITQID